MNNFDDILDTHVPKDNIKKPFNKEEWAEKKQSERQDIFDLADSTMEAVCADGNRFKEYLDVQTKFDRYSALNALLILAQMPQASQLKDFDAWKESSVSIKKEQKGISILAPGSEYTRENGTVATSYYVKKVFDVSQTTAKEQPEQTTSRDEGAIIDALIS